MVTGNGEVLEPYDTEGRVVVVSYCFKVLLRKSGTVIDSYEVCNDFAN